MSGQLAFDFFAPVPAACEALTFRCPADRPHAQIITRPAAGGYDCSYTIGLSMAGCSTPTAQRTFATRAEAILRACAEIMGFVSRPESGSKREVDQVAAWARGIAGSAN